MKMYATYGALAHEKGPVYTLGVPCGEIYDVYELTLPDGWEFADGVLGDTLIVDPEGTTYLASDILTNWGDEPALMYFGGSPNSRIMLTDYATKL